MQQMKSVMISAQSLLLLLVSTTWSNAVTTDNVVTFSTVLTYPPAARSSETSPVFRSHGKAYRFRLNPERDVDGTLLGFQLVMEGANSRSGRGPNLLDPTGRLHGYQKWDFLASEFVRDDAPPGWGDSRTIHLANRGLEVQINVVRFKVEPIPKTSATPAGYRFTDLALRIRARPASGEAR
jgi:hypothetical protein